MTPTQTEDRQMMTIHVDHPFCKGTGQIKEIVRRVKPSQASHHYRAHVYHASKNGEEVGERCNCTWENKIVERGCVGCGSLGYQVMTILVPEPGDKVMVRSQELLESLLGENPPTTTGTVYEVLDPDDHNLELPNGLCVQVTWDRLNAGLKIPKSGVTLWSFDITEVKVKQ